MSLKSVPLVVSKETPPTSSPGGTGSNSVETQTPLEDTTEMENNNKPDCWCVGRNYKKHKTGDPFCHFSGSYRVPKAQMEIIPPVANTTRSPVTFDEDIIMGCINRAIAKTPRDFVSMLDEGRVNHTQARHINNELRLAGYCISEEPF